MGSRWWPRTGVSTCGWLAAPVIRLQRGRGVTRVTPSGRVSRFATITAAGLINGITFDEVGAFGYRLLVTINHGSTTALDAVDCHGEVKTITRAAPKVEGRIHRVGMHD